ncbi:hypothetical protein ABT126_45220 [Streptomyces sp. NPDC002012]|uniref:hypothetical protein n=1 Tax=unclassified Streptomyces TaxID=2593676 RepID=UPI0033249C51
MNEQQLSEASAWKYLVETLTMLAVDTRDQTTWLDKCRLETDDAGTGPPCISWLNWPFIKDELHGDPPAGQVAQSLSPHAPGVHPSFDRLHHEVGRHLGCGSDRCGGGVLA